MGTQADIRTAGEDDLPQIVEIYNHAVAERGATADLAPVTVESRQDWFGNHPADTHPVWVAEQDGHVVGWCSLSAYRPGRAALRCTAEISYYVHKDYRRRGIASALIQWAMAQCPRLRIKNLFTLLLDVNAPSISILEKHGFARWGHLPDIAELDDTTCGHLVYGRRVNPST